jgi:hypothetical protein
MKNHLANLEYRTPLLFELFIRLTDPKALHIWAVMLAFLLAAAFAVPV